MAKNNLIIVYCLGWEIGRLGFDEDRGASFFQYNEDFLNSGKYPRLFPLLIRRIKQTQVFDKYNNETFRGLPPMIADSLPDLFGNVIFKTWIESSDRDAGSISALEQLTYVGARGMGALEYRPSRSVSSADTINLEEITEVVRQVLHQKGQLRASQLDHAALLNIFKIGSSAGGMRPKVLVSEDKMHGTIVAGDVVFDDKYDHYLVKLGIEEGATYGRELVEYTYYLAATKAGIEMMPSKMIEGKHFATLRFDRQEGRKHHILTATGMMGYDYTDPKVSSYENLFELILYLKCPHADVEQMFRRMVFNLVFANHDDHLKNHSFIYDEQLDKWRLAPAYDVTYSLNPELNIKTKSRALSINGKRTEIGLEDIRSVAERYSVRNFMKVVEEVEEIASAWKGIAADVGVPDKIRDSIFKNFNSFA